MTRPASSHGPRRAQPTFERAGARGCYLRRSTSRSSRTSSCGDEPEVRGAHRDPDVRSPGTPSIEAAGARPAGEGTRPLRLRGHPRSSRGRRRPGCRALLSPRPRAWRRVRLARRARGEPRRQAQRPRVRRRRPAAARARHALRSSACPRPRARAAGPACPGRAMDAAESETIERRAVLATYAPIVVRGARPHSRRFAVAWWHAARLSR